jgi:small subunit ribosomal protein S17
MKNERRRIDGVITSDKMTKTVTVEITRTFQHPLYKKVVHSKKRVLAHDELECSTGDLVRIVESQPSSKRKRWTVESILRKNERLTDVEASA